jgi:hypothetical protein
LIIESGEVLSMKGNLQVAVALFFSLGLLPGRGQQPVHGPAAQFPGSVLKWIHIAEKEFAKHHLDESQYVVRVWERQDSVTVLLKNPGHENDLRTKGDPGPLPEYEVEIDRRTLRVIHANYER